MKKVQKGCSKKRKSKHIYKSRKHRKTKRGGGYGANCSDPNYSIYNTRLLSLFPYTPTN